MVKKQLWIYEAKEVIPTKMSQVSMTTLRKIPTLTKKAKFPFTIEDLRFINDSIQYYEKFLKEKDMEWTLGSSKSLQKDIKKLIEELKTGD